MIKAEINDKELIKHLDSIQKDDMAIFFMADGRIRGALFNGTRFVNQMKVQHNLGILETMILGQASLCGALMIPMMKGKEHSVWKYNVDGPAAGFSIEADSSGYVRGFLLNNQIPVEKPLENWDLRPFLGTGTMTISRIHDNDKVPQSSTVEVNSKNIAEDLAWYYEQSEQLQTAFNTSIQLDKKGRVIGAGAMFLQVMPKTGGTEKLGSQVDSASDVDENEALLRSVENAFSAAPSLGQWFSEDGKIDAVKVAQLFQKDVVFNNSTVSKYIQTCRFCGIKILKVNNKYFVASLPFGMNLTFRDLDLLDMLQKTASKKMSEKIVGIAESAKRARSAEMLKTGAFKLLVPKTQIEEIESVQEMRQKVEEANAAVKAANQERDNALSEMRSALYDKEKAEKKQKAAEDLRKTHLDEAKMEGRKERHKEWVEWKVKSYDPVVAENKELKKELAETREELAQSQSDHEGQAILTAKELIQKFGHKTLEQAGLDMTTYPSWNKAKRELGMRVLPEPRQSQGPKLKP